MDTGLISITSICLAMQQSVQLYGLVTIAINRACCELNRLQYVVAPSMTRDSMDDMSTLELDSIAYKLKTRLICIVNLRI